MIALIFSLLLNLLPVADINPAASQENTKATNTQSTQVTAPQGGNSGWSEG